MWLPIRRRLRAVALIPSNWQTDDLGAGIGRFFKRRGEEAAIIGQ